MQKRLGMIWYMNPDDLCLHKWTTCLPKLTQTKSSRSHTMTVSAKNMLENCIYDTFGALASHRMLVARMSVECDNAMTRVEGG